MTRTRLALFLVFGAALALLFELRVSMAAPPDPQSPVPPLQPSASASASPRVSIPPPLPRTSATNPPPSAKELKKQLEGIIAGAVKRETGAPRPAGEKVELFHHPEFTLGQGRDTDQKYISMNSAPAIEAVSEAMSIMAEIVVERAKRNGLELLKARLIKEVCGVKQSTVEGAATWLTETCALVKQTSFERLAGEPTPLFVSLSRDLLAAGAASAGCEKGVDSVQCRFIKAVFPTLIRIVSSSIARGHPIVTKEDAWVVTSSVLNGSWLSLVTVTSRKGGKDGGVQRSVRFGLDAASICLKFKADRVADRTVDVACDLPMITRRLVEEVSGAKGIELIEEEEIVEASRIATLALQAALAMRPEAATGVQSPNAHERLRASVELVFAILDAGQPGRGVSKVLPQVKLLLLATLDGDEPRMIAAGAEILVTVLKDDAKGKRSLQKATVLLSAVAGYASTFSKRETDEKDKTALRESRKRVIEGLIDATTIRGGRYGELVWSFGSTVGFMMGVEAVRGASSGGLQFMPPQLSLPLGVAMQVLPGKGVEDPQPDQIYKGFHVMITVIDLGQFLAYSSDGTVTRPRWDTAFCPGIQLTLALGTPNNMFLIGPELRYAPTLFADTGSASPDVGGAIRVGLMASYYLPFFDLN
jgi:hypothetical protein